jgi:cell wall-associated NlpC family hydrolase
MGFALVACALMLPLVRTAPAAAAVPEMSSTGTKRDCVKTSLAGCVSRGLVADGSHLTMHCWKWGTEATGEYTSKKYFYVTVLETNQKGYVHSSRVINQKLDTKECGTHRGIATATWAAEHVAISKTTQFERTNIPTSTFYWSGYCATFTRGATKLGAGYSQRYAGDAKPRYDQYAAAGLVTKSGTPSIGAHVFWRNLSEWGHTAIYVGNGRIITTRGRPGQTLAVERATLTGTFGTPSGWVNPNSL